MGKESFLNVNVKVWRQRGPKEKGEFKTYRVEHVSTEMSFFEMMDTLNEQLINKHEEPIVFDHDCREGICGTCSLYINGRPHGIDDAITTCQLHMRKFKNEETITVEPWRSAGFPVIRDLMVDRSAFDKIQQAGGYTSINCGAAQDANAILISKVDLHRLRRLRCCLQERFCHALRQRQGEPVRSPATGQGRGCTSCQGNGSPHGRTRIR